MLIYSFKCALRTNVWGKLKDLSCHKILWLKEILSFGSSLKAVNVQDSFMCACCSSLKTLLYALANSTNIPDTCHKKTQKRKGKYNQKCSRRNIKQKSQKAIRSKLNKILGIEGEYVPISFSFYLFILVFMWITHLGCLEAGMHSKNLVLFARNYIQKWP